MRTILIVGGGYAGFYTAWKLEKKLRRGEARVIVVDPRPYMTYQPFLPEVLAGSVEARHAAVSLRRHLRRAEIVAGRVTRVDHAHKTVTVRPAVGAEYPLEYDIIVVTAGAVTRTLAIPGVTEHAIGKKHVEEAVAIRDRMLTAFDDAAIPDLAAERPGVSTVPNAQHAVRQGKLLARNLIATLRGREPRPYVHHSLGVVATLGLGLGIFQFHRLVIKGFPAWLMHRGYHALAVPTWERKVRVLAVWATAVPFGRDIVSLTSVQHPREAFLAGANPRMPEPAETADARVDIVTAGDAPRS
ncbi:FAD-dependent pyridine nucleotide-disulphide oxidoreductase [Parafrankia sp. EAN1pec]|uniref:NAD(P)/FAD-dependent oxidoreductase n=1 Tax=Parafrankia sp. (strain EAN1pec) TaxID=298653 RepID=UPI0000540F96|nr:FAD-dependent pyridine nucleotide-disulphide oxidoreductase [Frankia sp. EAN1pec]